MKVRYNWAVLQVCEREFKCALCPKVVDNGQLFFCLLVETEERKGNTIYHGSRDENCCSACAERLVRARHAAMMDKHGK